MTEPTKNKVRSRGKGVPASTKPNSEQVPNVDATKHESRGKARNASGKPNATAKQSVQSPYVSVRPKQRGKGALSSRTPN